MAKKQKEVKADVITGRNIYSDNKGRTIYYKKSTKQGFVIRPGSERSFKAYTNRILIAFIAAIFSYVLLIPNVLLAGGIAIVAFAFMQYRWMKLLSTYTMIQNFEPEKHESTLELIKQMDTGAILLRLGLYLALAVLIVLNAYDLYQRDPGTQTIVLAVASVFVSFFALFMSGRYGYALATKNK